MFLSAYLAIMLSQLPVDVRAGENPLTQFSFREGPSSLSFEWSDAEDALRGTLTPRPVRAGQPFTISATVQPINGAEFDGPVTFSLRPLDAMGSTQSVTVPRKPGEKAWTTTLTAEDVHEYRLEISWRGTHHKVVRAVLPVSQAGLPPWLTWVVGIGCIALAVGIGAWIILNRKES